MIDDPKLERLIKAVAQAAKNKEAEEDGLEAARARIPKMEHVAEQAATEYELALTEMAEYVRETFDD